MRVFVNILMFRVYWPKIYLKKKKLIYIKWIYISLIYWGLDKFFIHELKILNNLQCCGSFCALFIEKAFSYKIKKLAAKISVSEKLFCIYFLALHPIMFEKLFSRCTNLFIFMPNKKKDEIKEENLMFVGVGNLFIFFWGQ